MLEDQLSLYQRSKILVLYWRTNICELDQQIDTFAYLNALEEEGEADI